MSFKGFYYNDLLIPEVAVEAMMGDTCHLDKIKHFNDDTNDWEMQYECDECHYHVSYEDMLYNSFDYCPNCKRRIIEND